MLRLDSFAFSFMMTLLDLFVDKEWINILFKGDVTQQHCSKHKKGIGEVNFSSTRK